MSNLSQKDFERLFGELIKNIQKQATAFPNDTPEKKRARIARAKRDKFFFAVTYFPHYITAPDEFKDCWKDPEGKYDWLKAGFAPFHSDLFSLADILGKLSIAAGFRESAKDTIVCKIDVIWRLIFEDRWFIALIAKTEDKAETKVAPIKIEFEENSRIKNDFGELKGSQEWEYGSFVLSNGRKVKGYGREQSLVGEEHNSHRPDLILLNDLNDPFITESPEVTRTVVDRIKNSILYAVNSVRWSAVDCCNWTVKGDVTDELITGKNTSHFNKVIIRALVDNPQETKEQKEIARKCRDAGFYDNKMSAWEFRHPTLKLLQDQKNDPDTFNSQMMMIPRPRKDQKFKDNYFRYHTAEELIGKSYINYTFVDPSAKVSADYKAVITIGSGMRNGMPHLPIRRAWIQQSTVDEMINETYRHRKDYNSKHVGVETNGFQILLKKEYMRLQRLKKILLPFLEVVHAGESKQSRIERIVPFVKEGIITFDADDPDQDLLIQQLKVFPHGGQVAQGGIGDDGADALAGCVEIQEFHSHDGDVDYESISKQEAEFGPGAY